MILLVFLQSDSKQIFMKIVKHNVHLVFSVIFFLITFVSFGQTPAPADFSGGGTGMQCDPYVILTVEDWNAFARSVNDGYTYTGEYIKLGRDIGPVGEIVGACIFTGGDPNDPQNYVGNKFDGNFDGDWHTLNVELTQEHDFVAPFGWVNAASFSNLTVEGIISGGFKYYGGIIGCVEDEDDDPVPVKLTNCTSRVEIKRKVEEKAKEEPHHGGLVGWLSCAHLEFENCIFEGIFSGDVDNCAGFVGLIQKWQESDYVDVTYTNCTQAHDEIENKAETIFGTFHLPKTVNPKTGWGTAYCIHRLYEDGQGTLAYQEKDLPTNVILKIYEDKEHGKFYIPDATAVPTLDTKIAYLGTIPVKYYGKILHHGIDYTIDTEKHKILGIGDYAGSKSIADIDFTPFKESGSWEILKGEIDNIKSSVTITLDTDYKAVAKSDDALVFNQSDATVTLNLNGYTLDRNLFDQEVGINYGYVLSVEANATLIINGPGVITGGNIKGLEKGNSRGDGGGIHVDQDGTLTVNDVTMTRNKSERSYPSKTAKFFGTGTCIYTKGNTTINDCRLIDNRGDGGGSGVNTQGGTLVVNRTLIANNVAQSKGGGVRTKNSKSIVFNYCSIRNNTELDLGLSNEVDVADGGGLFFDCSATLNNCYIIDNNALWRGGGIFINSGTVKVNNCVIKHNSALGDGNNAAGETGGGGIFVYSGSVELDNTEITNNASYTIGGVCIKDRMTLKVKGKTIIDDNIGTAIMPNVYFESTSGIVNIIGTLDKDALIGVSRAGEEESNITSGFTKYKAAESNFRSDNFKLYWFVKDGKELKLQKTKYWHSVDWDKDTYCHYDSKTHTYRIDAPVIVNQIQDISGDTIVFKDSGGNKSTRAAIFIDQTKEKVEDSWVQHDGQLVYQGTPVKVTVLKNIEAATTAKDGIYGWYTISSPVKTPNLLHNTNLITAVSQPYNFDLMRFDATNQEFPWQTYVAHPEFTTLENGRGYLYRNAKSFVEESNGDMITGDVDVKLYEGWNLIGNPYTHDIIKGTGDDCAIKNDKEEILAAGYYQLANNGGWAAEPEADGSLIKMGEGLLVKAITDGNLTISNIAPKSKSRANDEYIKFSVANSEYEDATYAVFNDGYGLDKISHRNPDIPMIYINQNGEDYAIATMSDGIKSFNLNFKAKTTGKYTLRYKTSGDFSYLHVIDRLTGKDIDMLADEVYSFIASPKDTDARFIVRLNYTSGNTNNDIFAYQSESDIVVYGEGELQVFDVMGRMVKTQRINGVETVNVNATGVYIFKLNEKTQKIVVR